MRVIILGYRNCPHCRALLRLLKECSDITSVSYIEFSTFIETYLSEVEKELCMQKLKHSSIPLPYVLYKVKNKTWNELKIASYTKSVLEAYIKTVKDATRQ